MKCNMLSVALCASLLCLSVPIAAQSTPDDQGTAQTPQISPELRQRVEQIVPLINETLSEPLDAVFTPEFLKAVPPEQLATISQQLSAQFGAAIAVDRIDPVSNTRASIAIRMERAIARGGIALDASQGNRISELLFRSFDPVNDSVEKIQADLSALPGDVSVYFGPLDGPEPIISRKAGDQMPIGSTFKLYVLAALAEDVAEGKRSWSDTVELDTKSFPSGMMQDWPRGSPVTLHTLASLMISISDNTATDQLIALLGRERIMAVLVASGHSAPELNDPFLTTRELFLLKSGDPARLAAYSRANSEVRGQILDGMKAEDRPATEVNQAFTKGPIALDIEWFASANDILQLFKHMRGTADREVLEILAINGNLPQSARGDWRYAGYKGGSEPGVLNLTWLLIDQQGEPHLLLLSWRNPETNLEQTTLELIAQRILSLPH